ncbi:hypothetical protein ACTFIR_007510 [Dictyostelium discoideum]
MIIKEYWVLNQCKYSKLFSKYNMFMCYFQILINLVNSPSTFARLMVEIFGNIKKNLLTLKRDTVSDREFFSIIDSPKKFQHLLIGEKVSIFTDHQNLTYVINKLNDKPFTKRQDNYMKHISGKKNGIADFLSRKYDNFQWDESFLNKIKEKHETHLPFQSEYLGQEAVLEIQDDRRRDSALIENREPESIYRQFEPSQKLPLEGLERGLSSLVEFSSKTHGMEKWISLDLRQDRPSL